MKKKILTLGLFVALIFTAAKVAEACQTFVMTCPNGSHHYVVVCDELDFQIWSDLLCGTGR